MSESRWENESESAGCVVNQLVLGGFGNGSSIWMVVGTKEDASLMKVFLFLWEALREEWRVVVSLLS